MPLAQSLGSAIQKDFDIGAFKRFQDPTVALTIYDRPEFHDLTNFQIRELLDKQGSKDAFVVIDKNSQDSNAIWYVTSREESEYWTKTFSEYGQAPISYPEEAFVVWQLRLLTQDLPLQWINWDIANTDITEDIAQTDPYDPHDPQEVPYTLGVNFSIKHEAVPFLHGPYVEAEFNELLISNDTQERKRWLPFPPRVTRLTNSSASEAGLIPHWMADFGDPPRPGMLTTIQQPYDWDSPKWAENSTNMLKSMARRSSQTRLKLQPDLSNPNYCQKSTVFNVSSLVNSQRPVKSPAMQAPAIH